MASSDDARYLAHLAADLKAESGEQPTVEVVLKQALEIQPDADHVSVTVRQGQRWTTLAASSELAEQLDQLQYDLGSGPCVEAAAEADWFRSGDVGADHRWGPWGPRAAELGVGSLLSMQLLDRTDAIGAINFYAERQGAFDDPETIDLAVLYAVHATQAITASRHVTGLTTAMGSRHVIGLAQGRLMERYGLTADQALSLLRRASSHANRKVRDLAADLVDSGELPGV